MKMYYVTRFEHNPNRKTEYYIGNGQFEANFGFLNLVLFQDERDVFAIIENLNECDWHEIQIRV